MTYAVPGTDDVQPTAASAATVIDALLQHINLAHHTTFVLRERFNHGEQGAFLLADPLDHRYVLKWQPVDLDDLSAPASAPDVLQPAMQAALLDRLRAAGYPVPRVVAFGLRAGQPSARYAVHEALPGTPANRIDHALVDQVLALNDLQAGLASAGRDAESTQGSDPGDDAVFAAGTSLPRRPTAWPELPIADVLRGGDGYCLIEPMRRHSTTTAALLDCLQDYVTAHQHLATPRVDLVHFDLNPANILVDGDRVTGVVDWDGACVGDRAFDLCTLLFYAAHPRYAAHAGVRARLWERTSDISGAEVVGVYLAHMAHRQVEWMVRHHPRSVDAWLKVAAKVLEDVAHRTGWPKQRLLAWSSSTRAPA